MAIKINPALSEKIAINPSASEKIAIYDYGSAAVLKGGVEFGAEPTSLVDRSGYGNHGTYDTITDAQLSSGLWTWQFDGINSWIGETTANWRNGDSAGSIVAWVNPTDYSGQDAIFVSSDTAGNTYFVAFYIEGAGKLLITQRSGGTQALVTSTETLTNGIWQLASVVSSGTAWSLYLNDDLLTPNVDSGANTGDWFADTTFRDNWAIGTYKRTTEIIPFLGSIALVRVFPTELSSGNIATMYANERWLFGV